MIPLILMNKASCIRIDQTNLNTEKQARLEILLQDQKDLQTQVTRVKQTLEKVLDKNTSSAEKI